MASPRLFLLRVLLFCCVLHPYAASASLLSFYNRSSGTSSRLPGIEMPTHLSFNSVSSSAGSGCHHHLETAASDPPSAGRSRTAKVEQGGGGDGDVEEDEDAQPSGGFGMEGGPALKLHLKHRSARDPGAAEKTRKESLLESTHRDLSRIQTLFRRVTERKNQNALSRLTTSESRPTGPRAAAGVPAHPELAGRLVATLESGVTLGSGEYFMDVYVGTPPRHFSLILDTGSDLNWIQCVPCHDCFEQHGPPYDPSASSSYRNVSCSDPRCALVSSPEGPRPCRSRDQPCPYFYWYGDRSNTTGDLALETFTVNLTAPGGAGGPPESHRVEGVIFGCGHWNRGLFHGAAGLLGLGRGPLSFSSQLHSLYGHTFSYCLVDRNSDLSVSSKLVFGEDRGLLSHPDLNYTSFVAGNENPVDTFYYVQIKGIMVGGRMLDIPRETWDLSKDGTGGTIIDSGTTLSYFADPAYQVIKEAFVSAVRDYPVVDELPPLSPCYNVSGVEKVVLPEFAIVFGDGAVWNFPVENYFIRLEPEEIMCLAILGTPRSSLSILGNYQQQNFHILYDTKKFRLGFAPTRCAEV